MRQYKEYIMATPLSPSEQVAQAMLLLHSKTPILALEASNAISQALSNLFDNNPEPSVEEINAAKESAIQNLGYATDLDSVGAQYAYLKDQHAGFWSGSYAIVDSQNEIHSLMIDSTNVRLLLGGTEEVLVVASEGGGFSGQKLIASNDKVDVAFTFSTSADGIDLLTVTEDEIADIADRFHIQLSGSLTIKGEPPSVRSIQGKRGVSTAAGVFHTHGQEPGWIWVGQYRLNYTDTDRWDSVSDLLTIGYDEATQALTLQWGALSATDVDYGGDALLCNLEMSKGVITQVTMQLISTSGGLRKCYVWLETTGQMRTLTGYATDLLSEEALWRRPQTPVKALKAAMNTSAQSTNKRAMAAATASAPIVDFCQTVYDSTFSAGDLVSTATTAKTPAKFFETDEISVVSGTTTTIVKGHRVDEIGPDGFETGRIAFFTYDTKSPPTTLTLPANTTLKTYAPLDEALQPKTGLGDTAVGLLNAGTFELPGLVETDYYEVRMSLLDYTKVDAGGLDIALAIDDANQKKLVRLYPPTTTQATCVYTIKDQDNKDQPVYGMGPDPEVVTSVPDFTKASVLVRGATGETQNVGDHDYYFSVAPKGKKGFFSVNRTIYKPSSSKTGCYELVSSSTADVPILLHVLIHMDSRDALEVTGATWAPAVRGRNYSAGISALKGQMPYSWRLLNDALPAGLGWQPSGLKKDADLRQTGLTTVSAQGQVGTTDLPGTVFQPAIRIMSDKSCVMKPIIVNPQVVVAEPETEGRKPIEMTNMSMAIIGSISGFVLGVVGAVFLFRDRSLSKKDLDISRAAYLAERDLFSNAKVRIRDASSNKKVNLMLNDSNYVQELTARLASYDDCIATQESKIKELKKVRDKNIADKVARDYLDELIKTAEEQKKNMEKEKAKTQSSHDSTSEEEMSNHDV
jgi:hypothetical protein